MAEVKCKNLSRVAEYSKKAIMGRDGPWNPLIASRSGVAFLSAQKCMGHIRSTFKTLGAAFNRTQ
jgi:hypothetical protein